MTLHRRTLILLLLLLLMQVFIRANNITELPIFIDEDNHIRRAAVVYDLEMHPAQNSHGKFFLYFLLGIFDLKERDTALHLARTMVALTSLLTSAIIFAVVRKFANQSAALVGVAIYALLPYAFFYERMALADPFAGTLGALTLWQSIRLAEKPSYRRAAWVGTAAAMTVAAKLTMSFAVFFPVLAFLVFAAYQNLAQWLRCYMPYLAASGAVFTLLWLPVLIPARISLVNDDIEDYVIVNTELVDDGTSADSLGTKFTEIWTKLVTMSSLPAALALLVFGFFLWRGQPRLFWYLLGAAALAWIPTALIVRNLQTRYLMSGLPIVTIAAAVGLYALYQKTRQSGWVSAGAVWGLALWAAVFALPFAETLQSDPPAVSVPALDDRNYFWDRYNGYGNREALAMLAENGQRDESGAVNVMILTKVCRQMNLHAGDPVNIICIDGYERETMADIDWQGPANEYLGAGAPLYVLTSEQSDLPPPSEGIVWDEIGEYEKPRGIQSVTVWQLTLSDS